MMQTIQMTIDEELLQAVDTAVDHLGTSRSAFMREAFAAGAKTDADCYPGAAARGRL
jgi:metal-responsive CopG/Arc/MetJ family transcriptional regulator